MSKEADPSARARSLAKRAEIVAKVDALGEHDPAEVANLGFGKRIGDATSYAVGRMTDAYQARTIYATVAEIDQALERLDEGTYGRCLACGTAIPAERLEAVPWAALCVPCSAKPARRAGPLTRDPGQLLPDTDGAISPRPACWRSAGRATPSLLPRTSSCTRHSMIAARCSDWVSGRSATSSSAMPLTSALR